MQHVHDMDAFRFGQCQREPGVRTIHVLRDIRNLVGFAADETEQRRGERPADLGVVHALQSVAVGAQR